LQDYDLSRSALRDLTNAETTIEDADREQQSFQSNLSKYSESSKNEHSFDQPFSLHLSDFEDEI